jgi:hypothetical protein
MSKSNSKLPQILANFMPREDLFKERLQNSLITALVGKRARRATIVFEFNLDKIESPEVVRPPE